MKQLIFISILLLTCCLSTFAQVNSVCPKIEINVPTDLIKEREPLLASISLSGATPNLKIGYNWATSAGTITTGQGTPAIIVDTIGLGGVTITVTVEITGLAKECNNLFTKNGLIAETRRRIHEGMPAEEYGKISWNEEISKLDSLSLLLKSDIAVKAYILFSSIDDEKFSLLKKRITKVVKYLQYRRIKRERLIIEAIKDSEYIIRIWIIEKNGKIPNWTEIINVEKIEKINLGKL